MTDRTTTSSLVLPRLRPNPQAQIRLFCFPYAGGTAMIYRGWQELLPQSVEVCPVQLPGRANRLREQPFTHVTPMVRALSLELSPYLDKPFAFFGHSMGATISFELARRLRSEMGLEPLHLFVSARRAPHVPNPDPPVYNLPEPELIQELRRLNGTPAEALEHPELMQMLLPLLRADFSVSDTYTFVPEPPLSSPITAFGGLEDTLVKHEHVEAWREMTTGAFTLSMLPGDHFFINQPPPFFFQTLARTLHELTQRAA